MLNSQRPTILLDLFVAFQRSAQVVELTFAEHGLDVPDYAIVSTIGVEGPVTATALARRLGMPQRTMLFRVRRLVEGGLVERTASTSDRRAIDLTLTSKGEAVGAAARPVFRRMIHRLERRLGDPAAVKRALVEMSDALATELEAAERRTGD